MTAVVSLVAMMAIMLGELVLSRVHETALRKRGATEPSGDVYRQLAWVYPATFVAMASEGVVTGLAPGAIAVVGLLVLVAAKALKAWAISSLGERWTYRVLVLPDTPLVTRGPYAWARHPNYLAVFGEIIGFALLVGALVAGAVSLVALAVLVRKRIAVEERALGRRL